MSWSRMRRQTGVVLVIAGVAILSPVFAQPAIAQTYLGDLCWSVTTNEGKAGPVTPIVWPLRTSLTWVGGLHLLFQGTYTVAGKVGVVHGAGELVGTDFVISMAFSHDQAQSAQARDAGTLELRVNAQTWSGTYWAVGSFFNTATRAFDHDYTAGTAGLVSCP